MNRQRLILGVAGPAILAIAIIVLGLSLKAGIEQFYKSLIEEKP